MNHKKFETILIKYNKLKFKGDFDQEPKLLHGVKINLTCDFNERLSTGYYLPAGTILLLAVDSGTDFNGWSIRIGAHTDDLSNCEKLLRWPCVTSCKSLARELSFSSPFGGLIYFESSGPGSLSVCLNNVIESPFIDLNKPSTIYDWPRRCQAAGLWVFKKKFKRN